MEIRPEDLSLRDRYKLLIGCVVPRPIAFVSSVSPDGARNLAPFSFFNGVTSDPMTLVFTVGNQADGSPKDTLRNVRPESEGGVGEFVVNLAVARYRQAVAAAAEPLPYGDSEFELVDLEEAPSAVVRPPRVAASPAAFECVTERIVGLNPGQPGGGSLVIGRVVYIHLDDDAVNERFHVDAASIDAIGRMGGADYCTTRDRFSMPRGREALDG